MGISRIIYNLAIRSYGTGIKAAAVADAKAKLWTEGRKGLLEKMEKALQPGEERVWIHCSSLGEFEQGRPLIEAIRRSYPSLKIVLSFFSPSGYETRKNYKGADYVFYLPLDTPRYAAAFIDLVRPSLAIFVKYEFWYNYLNVLHGRHIPAILISAIFRGEQVFFRWYGKIFRELLGTFEHIFVQDDGSRQLLERLGIRQVSVSGDTRFDRVAAAAVRAAGFPDIEKFTGKDKVWIAGSTWPGDEKILAEYFWQEGELIQMIIVPHEINEAHLRQIEHLFEGAAIRYSRLSDTDIITIAAMQVLIIDNVGMLASLYQYGFAAYIGGGFQRDGIHNILEAAVYGLPVFFGPNYGKFREAGELIARGAAFPVNSADELKERTKALQPAAALESASKAAKNYVMQNTGATEKVLHYIAEKRFFTML